MMSQRLIAKVEPLVSINLVGKQAILGLVKIDLLSQTGFNQDFLLTTANPMVNGEIIRVRNRSYLQGPALITFDLVARAESDPGKRSLPLRIGSAGTTDGKVNGDLPVFNGEYLTHPQFRFSIADPALTQAESGQTEPLELMAEVVRIHPAAWLTVVFFEFLHICNNITNVCYIR